jgi:alkylation response protein AidB-like acyl-CoA dehydrogenase
MDLDLTSDQRLFAETTTRFLEDTSPLTAVRELESNADGFDRAWWRRAAELGWTSMLAPESRGGGSISDHGLADLALVAYQRGRLVSPGPFVPTNVVVAALAEAPSLNESQASLLADLLAGERVAAYAVDEPRSGSGVEAAPTASGYALSGVKSPVEAAVQADAYLVAANSPTGPIQVCVPAAIAGVTVSARDSVDLVRRFGAIEFDSVEVNSDDVIGEGAAAAARSLDIANVLQIAETVGGMDRVFQFTMEWAFDRHTFGRPLASYQELKHRFADMKLWLEASKATVWEAVCAVAVNSPDSSELASAAKSYVATYSTELMQDCVQMHGGIGVTWEHDIHLYLRRATVNRNVYGAPRDHRIELARLLVAAREAAT